MLSLNYCELGEMPKSRAKRRRALLSVDKVSVSGVPSTDRPPACNGSAEQSVARDSSGVKQSLCGQDPGAGQTELQTTASKPSIAPFSDVSPDAECDPQASARYLARDVKSVSALFRQVSACVSDGRSNTNSRTDLAPTLTQMRHCLSHLELIPRETLICGGNSSLIGWCWWLTDLLKGHRSISHALHHSFSAVCQTLGQLLAVISKQRSDWSTAQSAAANQRSPTVNTSLVGSIVTALIRPESDACIVETPAVSFVCLTQLIISYARLCTQYKSEIQRCVTFHIDSQSGSVSRASQRCYAVLYRITSAGVSAASGWRHQMLQLIFSTHQILDQLFDGISEATFYEIPEATFMAHLRQLDSTDPLQQRHLLGVRVIALLNIIAAQLSVATVQPVAVPVTHLLHLVSRCLHVSPDSTGAVTMETDAVLRVSADIHSACLRLLQRLTVSCGRGLVLNASYINRLLCTALSMYGEARRCSQAQNGAGQQAARALSTWLAVMGCASGVHSKASHVVQAILVGCSLVCGENGTPEKNEPNTISPASVNNSSRNKRKRKKPASDWSSGDRVSDIQPMAAGDVTDRCVALLDALTKLVFTAGPLLGVTLHKSLQAIVVAQLASVVRVCQKWRSQCYRLLTALVVSNCAEWPPPHQSAISLIRAGLFHTDPQVVAACTEAMCVWSRSVRPGYPSLEFPPVPPSPHSSPYTDQSQSHVQSRDTGDVTRQSAVATDSTNDEQASSTAQSSINGSVLTNGETDAVAVRCHDNAFQSNKFSCSADVVELTSPTPAAVSAGRATAGVMMSRDVAESIVHQRPVTTVTLDTSSSSDGGSSSGGDSSGDEGGADDGAVSSLAPSGVSLSADRPVDIVLDSDGECVSPEIGDDVQFVTRRASAAGACRHDSLPLPAHPPPPLVECDSSVPDSAGEDAELAPHVAEMLKDFVNVDPEVE